MESNLLELVDLLLRSSAVDDSVSTVYTCSHCFDLFFDRHVRIIYESVFLHVLLAKANDFIGKIDSAFSALCPYFTEHYVYSELAAFVLYQLDLCFSICREFVQRDNCRDAVDLCDILQMLQKIRKSLFECFQILRPELFLRYSAVILEGADSCYDDDCAGMEIRETALDVEELLGAEICGDMVCYTI